MSKKLKKIVAREVLIFFGLAVIIGMLIFYLRYSDDNRRQVINDWEDVGRILKSKYDSVTNEDSIKKRPYVVRIMRVIKNKYIVTREIPSDSIFYYKMILDEKFIDQVYAEFKIKVEGFDEVSREKFGTRIKQSIEEGHEYYKSLHAIEKSIAFVEEKISDERHRGSDMDEISKVILIIILSVAYPARLLYYLIRWSIVTLRDNESPA